MKRNTKSFKLSALLAAALFSSNQFVLAAEAGTMRGMPGMNQTPAQSAEAGHAVGVVHAINTATNTVTIVSEAVPERSWPADMSMEYKVAGDVAARIKVGQKVNFEFTGPGMDVTITKIVQAQ